MKLKNFRHVRKLSERDYTVFFHKWKRDFLVGSFHSGNIEEYAGNKEDLENQIIWLDEPTIVLPNKIKYDKK